MRADVKALDNRLWLVAGVRFERTDDKGHGPLNDITNTYVKNAAGQIVLGTNGRPLPATADALQLARLQFQERAAYSEKSYDDYYPSLNASYNIGRNFVLRSAYARTIGRPDLSFITPGTSISDPSAAAPTITVINTGLHHGPRTTTISRSSRTSSGSDHGRERVSQGNQQIFHRGPHSRNPGAAGSYGLPESLLSADYEIITRENSAEKAVIDGFEWSWRQSLRPFKPLPVWARSVSLFLNGTHLRIGGPGGDNFSGYSTRIINCGAAYARGNFAVKFSATYSNGPRNAVVAANATTPAGTYTGLAPRTLLGGSIEYRVNKWLTMHASGQNLTNALYRNMTFSRARRNTPDRLNTVTTVWGTCSA